MAKQRKLPTTDKVNWACPVCGGFRPVNERLVDGETKIVCTLCNFVIVSLPPPDTD